MPRGRAIRQSFERLQYDVSYFQQRSALSISARVESPAIALVVAVVLGSLICHVAAASDSALSEPQTTLTTATLATSEELVWTWSRAAELPTMLINQHAAPLPDGRALIFGGVERPETRHLSTEMVYDPLADEWTSNAGVPEPAPGVTVYNTNLIHTMDRTLIAAVIWQRHEELPEPPRRGIHLYIRDTRGDWGEIELPPIALDVFETSGALPVMDTPVSGKLIAAGGRYSSGNQNHRTIDTVLEYDLALDTWRSLAPLRQRRERASGLALADGRLMVAAGYLSDSTDGFPDPDRYWEYLTSTEIYDPVTNEWTEASDTPHERTYGSSFRMIDGRILIFGGLDSRFVDLYDPATDTWRSVGETAQPGSKVSVAQASTGEVLIAGGVDRELEVFDPATEEWSRIPLPDGMETDETVTEIGADRWLVTGFGETSAAILQRGDGIRRVFVPFVIRQVR